MEGTPTAGPIDKSRLFHGACSMTKMMPASTAPCSPIRQRRRAGPPRSLIQQNSNQECISLYRDPHNATRGDAPERPTPPFPQPQAKAPSRRMMTATAENPTSNHPPCILSLVLSARDSQPTKGRRKSDSATASLCTLSHPMYTKSEHSHRHGVTPDTASNCLPASKRETSQVSLGIKKRAVGK